MNNPLLIYRQTEREYFSTFTLATEVTVCEIALSLLLGNKAGVSPQVWNKRLYADILGAIPKLLETWKWWARCVWATLPTVCTTSSIYHPFTLRECPVETPDLLLPPSPTLTPKDRYAEYKKRQRLKCDFAPPPFLFPLNPPRSIKDTRTYQALSTSGSRRSLDRMKVLNIDVLVTYIIKSGTVIIITSLFI